MSMFPVPTYQCTFTERMELLWEEVPTPNACCWCTQAAFVPHRTGGLRSNVPRRLMSHGMLSESHQPINSISRLPKILESHALLHFPVSDEALGSWKVDVFLSITDCLSLWYKLRFSSAMSSEPLVHRRIP